MKEILEPLKEYQNYQAEFSDAVDRFFEDLKKQSNVDESKNRETVEKYNHIDGEYKASKKKLGRLRFVKSLMIFLAVASGIAIVIGGLMLYNSIKGGTPLLTPVLILVFGVLILVGAILLTKLLLDKKIKILKSETDSLKQNSDSILQEAWGQMAPLNRLFSDDLTRKIINSLGTVVQLDRFYSVLHEVYLNRYFNFPFFSDADESTINMVVGTIAGNPFVISRELETEMGTKMYEGALVVSWTERRRDSQGKTYTVTKTQTLIATVTKPCPYYDYETFLLYCNESSPDLNFSRKPQAKGKDDKQIERMVKRGERKLEKIAEKDMKHGDGSFIAMSNTEFDILFGAFDRNNETQFRLLFTPLAQRNTIDFIKDSPYGDDFYFVKRGKVNTIYSHHSDDWNMSQDGNVASYSIDIAEQKFKLHNNEFFKNLYFLLGPLLNIPLYQQHKPNDMDIDLSSETNIAARLAELLCNLLPSAYVAPPGTATKTICKVKYKPSIGLVDNVVIFSQAYKIVSRTDFVPRVAGNGRVYSVPVVWDEYISLTKYTDALVFDTNGLSEQNRNELISLLLPNALSGADRRAFAEHCGIVMVIPKDGCNEDLAQKINKILKTKKKGEKVNSTQQFFEAVEEILSKQND